MAGAFKQFGTLTTLDGFDVICEATGRPVAHYPERRQAAGKAFGLNEAAAAGPAALAAALGATQRPQRPKGHRPT